MEIDVRPTKIACLASELGLSILEVVVDDGAFEERITPVAGRTAGIPPHLAKAWTRLASTNVAAAQTLADLIVVLLETSPAERTARTNRGAFAFAPSRAPFPTAAHPRGFRGTKSKPAKCRGSGRRSLLSHFSRPADMIRLLASYDDDAWGLAGGVLTGLGYDPALVRWARALVGESASLPQGFVRTLLPSMRGAPWGVVRSAAGAFMALELDVDAATRAAVARIFAINGSNGASRSLAWLQWVARTPLEYRRVFSKVVACTPGAPAFDPPDLPFFGVGGDASVRPLGRLDFALRSMIAGVDMAYIRDGFALADSYEPDHAFGNRHPVRYSRGFDIDLVKRLTDRRGERMRGRGALAIWEACGVLPLLTPALRRLERALSLEAEASTLGEVLELLEGLRWEDLPRNEGKAAALLERTVEIVEWMRCLATDQDRARASLHLSTCLDALSTRADVDALLTLALALIARTLRKGEAKGARHAIAALVEGLNDVQLRALVAADDKSFASLVAACRRENDAWLLGNGLTALCNAFPDLTVRAFERHPRKLFAVAREVGILGKAWARNLLRTIRLPAASDVSDDLAALRATGRTNPVPRRLREHLEGRTILSRASLARHLRVVSEQIDVVALDAIRIAARRELGNGVDVKELGQVRAHALCLLGWTGENRRPLRRLIQSRPNGSDDYIFDHPQARAWLARHPRLLTKLSIWREGVRLTRQIAGKAVTLSPSRDPLETLRMGTYVGSCLGLGGGFTYSAAAAALDLNKRVIYARDARRVVGRQLIAWAAEGCLVCFRPYPSGMANDLVALFGEYDEALARALQVPIHAAESDEDYTISDVLSHGFWDDGAWNRD